MAQVNTSCCDCGIVFGVPDSWLEQKRLDKAKFYCPNGHTLSYNESSLDKMRRERDRAVQQQARLEEEKREVETRAAQAEAATARLKKRAAAGTCPCCTRSFTNMARHMQTKHPDWKAEAVKPNLKVVA